MRVEFADARSSPSDARATRPATERIRGPTLPQNRLGRNNCERASNSIHHRRIMLKSTSSAEDVATLQELLRGAGLRSTSARIAVLQCLRSAKSPLSHAELADELTPLGLDKATVFRNLSDLTDAGLVVRTELGDHVWRF